MASVETVVHYSHGGNVVQEAPHEIEDKAPAADWPKNGAIEFKDIVMRYRPGLPYVLKGLSLSIKGGEKIGVVGRCVLSMMIDSAGAEWVPHCRTGAGKSSLMLALFRIVELSSGSITIDGYVEYYQHLVYAYMGFGSVDISTIGLKDLRTKVAIIPQDVRLDYRCCDHVLTCNDHPAVVVQRFVSVTCCREVSLIYCLGTIRSNLDPFSVYDDVRLWDALRRSYLVESTDKKDASSEGKDTAKARFTLDTIVEGEGANLSVGERSILSLARALAKDSKVVGECIFLQLCVFKI